MATDLLDVETSETVRAEPMTAWIVSSSDFYREQLLGLEARKCTEQPCFRPGDWLFRSGARMAGEPMTPIDPNCVDSYFFRKAAAKADAKAELAPVKQKANP
jgi:hypothetical protein